MSTLRAFIIFITTALLSPYLFASDGRTMTDKLTCYNYEERIVFILDLKKDNEKLNNMNLAVVKRTKDSIEFVAPDLLIKFDSQNYIMNVIPTRASEALTMNCTTD